MFDDTCVLFVVCCCLICCCGSCSLRVVCCVFLDVGCLFLLIDVFGVCCSLCNVRRSLSVVRCWLFVVC